MWGIIPAAGLGTRIQPLAFSKELLPVGSRMSDGVEHPKAVSEYIVERMLRAGVDKLCFVISPGKSDIVRYFGSDYAGVQICYVVQPQALGLCDAVFRALPLVREDEGVLVGLPDTVWFPDDGYTALSGDALSFLLFPVTEPERFDAVVCDEAGRVQQIQVKQRGASSNWIWGGFRASGRVLGALWRLWCQRGREDAYVGSLVNEYIARGHAVYAHKAGSAYCDVGTLDGYRLAMQLLEPPMRPVQPQPAQRFG
jgi:glucose-1-phosphate thymidylyltransferase